MAISSTCVWELRTTGGANNGGGFNPALGGVDYSQRDTPIIAPTDVACTGNTTFTSAAGLFTPQMVGSVGFLVGTGLFEIKTYVSATQVTVDKNGPNASGLTFNVGGAQTMTVNGMYMMSSSFAVPGNKIWIKGGSYGLTVNDWQVNVSGTATQPITIEGYSTVRGDGGRPVIGCSLNPTANVSGNFTIIKHLIFDGQAGGTTTLLVSGGNNIIYDCIARNGAIACDVSGSSNKIRNCWFKGNAGGNDLVRITGTPNLFEFNVVQGSASGGINANNGGLTIRHNLIWGATFDGIYLPNGITGGIFLLNNILWGNGRDGFRNYGSTNGVGNVQIEGNVFGKNAGYDLSFQNANLIGVAGVSEWAAIGMECNAFYTTGTGRYYQIPANPNDLVLTADPFNNSAGGDFTPNNATGGGALLRTTPCAESYADGINSGSFPIGALGAPAAPANVSSMRSLWRELTNEHDSVTILDSVVDLYLNRGLEALNRLIRYHWTTDSASLTLVAGTQEYSLPTALIELQWVEWQSRELEKGSVEQWRRGTDPWRTEADGEPREWAHYGQTLVMRPTPSAAAVAKQANPILRYVSKPDDFTAFGPLQLNSQDYAIPVYYAAAMWSICHPESALSASRAKDLMDLFNQEAERVKADYKDRGVSK